MSRSVSTQTHNMDLQYYTSLEKPKAGCPSLVPDYHTSITSPKNIVTNLKKYSNKIHEDDIFTLAYLACNEFIPEEERQQYKNKMREIYQKESNQINALLERRALQQNKDSQGSRTDGPPLAQEQPYE